MSEENVEVVRAIYEAWMSGDNDRSFQYIDEDVEFTAPPDFSGGGQTFRGHASHREAIATWVREWDDYRFELRELLAHGDEVLAEGVQRGRGKGSGIDVTESIYSVWTVRSGRAVRHRMFRDRGEALEAAGLSE